MGGDNGVTIELLSTPAADEEQTVRRLLQDYNVAHSDMARGRPLVIVARHGATQLVGGVLGETWGEVFELNYLVVAERWRRHGIGRQLMRAAETEAIARGCRRVVLDTYSFQAPDYYLAHGYRLYARVEGFGGGVAKYFFTKELVNP